MPDSRRFALLLFLIACPASGTVTAQTVAEARARAEQLLAEYRAGQRAEARANEANWRAHYSDTVRVGGLTVVTRGADHQPVESAARAAWPRIESRYGQLSNTMARFPIWVERVDSAGSMFGVSTRLPDGSVTSQRAGAGEVALTAGLLRYADLLLWGNADSALSGWYPANPDAGLDPAVMAERAYLEVVTSLSVEARSCLIGDDRACSEALGLREVADPLINSYDAAARRALTIRIEPLLELRPFATQFHNCVDEYEDAACVEILRAVMIRSDSFGVYQLPPPMGDVPRRALVAQMERLGGPEAWSRLLASAGQPLETRLAKAAGVPPDSLMRVWRRSLLVARPMPVSVSSTAFLVALFWGSVGLAFALRCSRWY